MTKRIAVAAVLLCTLIVPSGRAATAVPPLSKVFVIVLENQNYNDVFGSRAFEAPYLNALANAHVRHDAFYAIAHVSLGNYIGMVSGQIPLPLDHADCPPYPVCVRPGPTIGAQMDAAGRTWRGYFQSMQTPCRYPSGVIDTDQTGYATRHNPFVYFSEIVGDAGYCAAHDVPHEGNFAADLAGDPADFSFIVPNTCDDGHDPGCAGDLTQIQILDRWLAGNVPPILDYIATDPNAALFITFDEAAPTDTTGCCDQAPRGQGGGHIGLVMVAPGLEGTPHRVTTPGNLYSLLRTIEDGFGLPALGEAGSILISPMTDLFG